MKADIACPHADEPRAPNPWHLVAVLLLVVVLYAPTITFPFVFDDGLTILENPLMQSPLIALFPPKSLILPGDVPKTAKTRPVGYASFALNHMVHGTDPRGYHAVNILVHVAASFCVYVLVVLTARTPRLRGSALAGHANEAALVSALLFAAHPVSTQAVTYISQRFASLVAVFYGGTVAVYAAWRLKRINEGGRLGPAAWYALGFLLALLAMYTKETAFTLPLALALYEAAFFDGTRAGRALYVLPFAVLALAVPLALMRADLPLLESLSDATRMQSAEAAGSVSRIEYLLTESRVAVTYLRLIALPVGQTLDYDYVVHRSAADPAVLASLGLLLAILAGLAALAAHGVRRGNGGLVLAAFGGAWVFIALSVESGPVPIADVIFEHRLYLPGIGAALAAAALYAFVLEWKAKKLLVRLTAAALVLILSALTLHRNEVWRSSPSLWADVVSKAPFKARGHYNLGHGYSEARLNEQALMEFKEAARLDPGLEDAHYNLGIVSIRAGLHEKAVDHFVRALALDPYDAQTLVDLGTAYAFLNSPSQAIRSYEAALALNPRSFSANLNLGSAYAASGRLDLAIEHFSRALTIDPENAVALDNLARANRSLDDAPSK